MNKFVAVAFVTSVSHKGLLKVKFLSEHLQQIKNKNWVFVDFFGNIKKIFVDEIISQNDNVFIKLRDFKTKRELEIFKNKEILIPKSQLVLSDDTYLISDLMYCEVLLVDKIIGRVEDIIDVPMNQVLIVRRINNSELLIPFVLKFFDKIDIEKKKIYLNRENRFLYDEN